MERKAPAYQHVPIEEVELRDGVSSGMDYPSTIKQRGNDNRFRNLGERIPSRRKVKSLWSQCKPPLIAVCIHALSLATISFMIVGIVLSTKYTFGSVGSTCSVNGQYVFTGFGVDSEAVQYNAWTRSEMFSINLAFGKLHFGRAKLIDVVWDVGVGRGGQTLLAIVSYRMFNQAIARLMEVGSVSRATFEAVALEQGSIFALVKIVRDFYKNEGARAKAVILWMVASMIIVLVFPTLTSAMTGYSVNFEAYVSDPDESLLLLSDFRPIFYIIHDGSRLGSGFHDDYIVADYSAQTLVSPFYACAALGNTSAEREGCRSHWKSPCSTSAPGQVDGSGQIVMDWNNVHPACDLLWQVSAYTYEHGLNVSQNTTSSIYDRTTGTNITLPSPTLNVSHHFLFADRTGYAWSPLQYDRDELSWAVLPYGSGFNSSDQSDHSNWIPDVLYTNNQSSHLFDFNDMSNGICQQPQVRGSAPVTYSWGFSLQLLVCCLVILLVWTIGTYTLYVDCYLNGNQAILKRNMGMQRAILDLAIEYQKQVGHVDDVSMHTNAELRDAIGDCRISYTALVAQNPHAISRLKRLRQRRWGKVWWRQKRYIIPSSILAVCLIVIIPVFVELTEYS